MGPMKFRITSDFGALEEIRNYPHTGIDFSMPEGTELRSITEGVIERVIHGGDIGKGIVIRADDGTQFIYGHLSNIKVKTGETVGVGDLIGLSGNTGNSTGPHLHFGMVRHGEYIDPAPLADTISSLSGKPARAWWDVKGRIGDEITSAIDGAKERVKDAIQEQIYEWLYALGEVAAESLYGITLIGTTVLIILKIAGYPHGFRYAGVLFVSSALIRMILKGLMS